MPDEQNDPMSSQEAFHHALHELIEEYLDTVIEELRTPDAEWARAEAAGWEAGRAAALKELPSYQVTFRVSPTTGGYGPDGVPSMPGSSNNSSIVLARSRAHSLQR